jgi:hypothetical protein
LLLHSLDFVGRRYRFQMSRCRFRRATYVDRLRQVELSRLEQLLPRRVVADAQDDPISNS